MLQLRIRIVGDRGSEGRASERCMSVPGETIILFVHRTTYTHPSSE